MGQWICEAAAEGRAFHEFESEWHEMIHRMATMKKLKGKAATEIQTVCGYFTNNAGRMKYDEYLKAGCPIATGVIEGACRHLVKDRMERSGMRWTVAGAQPMPRLTLRHASHTLRSTEMYGLSDAPTGANLARFPAGHRRK